MANAVVKTAADLNTEMDDTDINPTVETSGGDTNRKIIHITLVAEGVNITGADIYDALDAEWAVVAGEKSSNTRGTYIFNIGPA